MITLTQALIFLFLVFLPLDALADEEYEQERKKVDYVHAKRCREEWHTGESALGRIEWAIKCHYLDHEDLDMCKRKRLFPTFARAHAPYDKDAPCSDAWGGLSGLCIWGCYVPEQSIMFDGREVPIVEALSRDLRTITTLSDLEVFSGGDAHLTEIPIGTHASGQSEETVITIESTAQHIITVSLKHPLVEWPGKIITADKVEAGKTILMGASGNLPISAVHRHAFTGVLHNFSPDSSAVPHNIFISGGFFSGSLRYQNDWAEDQSRLLLRALIRID